MTWPEHLLLDAWAGGTTGVGGDVDEGAGRWSRRSPLPRVDKHLFPGAPADPRDWKDPRVGWGLVLPDDEAVPATERGTAVDAPEPIRRLVAARAGAPVLRTRPDRVGKLRRYAADGTFTDLEVAATEFGVEPGHLPRYLLLYGSPAAIPWDVQFLLNARFAVGRLDLAGDALEHYVAALESDWAGSTADPFRSVVWATEFDSADISALMKRSIAKPVFDQLAADPTTAAGAVYLGTKHEATAQALAGALAERVPGLIVTTSHGATGDATGGPTVDTLGLPVDDAFVPVTPGVLLAGWQPNGAIWYAHACCSAGSSALTVFHGLFAPASSVGQLLASVAALGDQVAPLPRALLGHERPLRAFIGHVEPTFDWTMRERETGQILTGSIRQGLYDNLYQPRPYPVGLAFEPFFAPIGALSVQQEQLRRRYAHEGGAEKDPELLATQLAARDRMSMVILGDPTVVVHPGA